MNIVTIYLAYLLVSAGLTVAVGRVLSRSGRLFLLDIPGGGDGTASDRAASGISSLIAVSFYLISAGFIALTLPAWSGSITASQAVRLLATKLGVLLLVLAALYLAGIITLAKLRRRLRLQARAGEAGQPGADPVAATRPAVRTSPGSAIASPGLWRPARRSVP
jgi:hypothetical protein